MKSKTGSIKTFERNTRMLMKHSGVSARELDAGLRELSKTLQKSREEALLRFGILIA